MKLQPVDFLRSQRVLILCAFYAVVAGASLYLAYEVRFDFAVPPEFQRERAEHLLGVMALKVVALILARQARSMITFFGVPDFFRLAIALSGAALALLLPRFVSPAFSAMPRGVVLIDFLLCLAALCAFRLAARLFRERFLVTAAGAVRAERVVVIGAGHTGASLVRDLIATPARGFQPVAIFDDDHTKHGQFIHGIRVEGTPEDFPRQAALRGVTRAIIAMPSAAQKRVAAIALELGRHGIHVETVPALEDLASGRARVSRIRPIEIQDLLGRPAVTLDLASIRDFVQDRVVMVTGAGGSIGSEICRQVARLAPRRLLVVERSEPALFQIEQELIQQGLGGLIVPIAADVLDQARMAQVFALQTPGVIFHAAAHKHVFLMERQPAEAIKNNAIGTRRLAELAVAHGSEAFVLISTDKAINPTSAMGASKRLAELHLQALHEAQRTSISAVPRERTKLMAVRFGNVLGSSGSVVTIFKKQIETGGPVTVTHPEVVRYFMTIPEAVGLVLQASAMGKGGEIFVLDMGQPMKILDLARNMIELSGYRVGDDIEIKFVGLKPGEKLYEELQHETEEHEPTEHPRIMRFRQKTDSMEASRRASADLDPALDKLSPREVKQALKAIVPEYQPYLE